MEIVFHSHAIKLIFTRKVVQGSGLLTIFESPLVHSVYLTTPPPPIPTSNFSFFALCIVFKRSCVYAVLPGVFEKINAMFTLYRLAFAPAWKPYRIGLLFKNKNGDFITIAVTKRSCTALISVVDLEVAHPQSGSSSAWFLVELEFRNVGFWGEGKTGGVPGEKPLGAKERINNKLNPHMVWTPGFDPVPHWWEASALTTVPSLAPQTR